MMTKRELEQYLLQSLNMGLGSLMQGETSYTNSFDCKIMDDGFLFLPRLPAGYIIDDDLYQKIFLIANASLYPRYTLLKQNSAYFMALDTNDIHVQRGLFFPWKLGVSERLIISDLDSFAKSHEEDIIPIMKNLVLDYNNVTSLAIAGNSGSGKSYTLTYLLSHLKQISDLIIIPHHDGQEKMALPLSILNETALNQILCLKSMKILAIALTLSNKGKKFYMTIQITTLTI